MHTPIRASKVFKIILTNLSIFFLCLLLIEVFFIINSKYKFINPPQPHTNKAAILSPKAAEDKYGASVFSVPDQYKTIFDEKLKNLKNAQIDHFNTMAPAYDLFAGKGVPGSVQVQAYLLPPNENIKIYDVEYKIDKYRRRFVENQKNKKKSTKYLLALGDSRTFGIGVTSGHDYPSQLTKKISSDIKVYNFGTPGFGPNDFLFQLQTDPKLLNEITQNEGLAIWFFTKTHFERFFCDLKCYQKDYDIYINRKPHYELIDNRLVFLGPFSESWTFKRKLLYYLAQSETVKFFDFKFNYSGKQIQTLVASFKEIKTLLEQKKNLKKIFFLISQEFKEKDQLIQLLKNENIDVVDISDIPFYKMKTYIPFDGHPASNHNWIISEILKKHIAP